MKRALVTGASGFVGRHLVPELARRGVRITTAGRGPGGGARHFALGPAPWNPSVLATIIDEEEPDAIFHLAGIAVGSSQTLDEVNWGVATAFMQALSTLQMQPLFVCCGSAAEYGAGIVDGVPVRESADCLPRGTYGASKLAQTEAMLSFSGATGTPVLVARLFNPIGPGMPRNLALADFAWQIAAAEGARMVLRCGNLDVWRDYIDVAHVATTLCRLASNPAARGVVNVCSGRVARLRDLVAALIAISGAETVLEVVPSRLREGECRTIVGSTARLEELDAMPPPTDYEDAITRLWNDTRLRWSGVVHA